MAKDPILYKRTTADIREQINTALADRGWPGQPGGASQAMVKLFSHFADVIIKRLNRVPEQHMIAFLNEAEIERLPARPANTARAHSARTSEPSGRLALLLR